MTRKQNTDLGLSNKIVPSCRISWRPADLDYLMDIMDKSYQLGILFAVKGEVGIYTFKLHKKVSDMTGSPYGIALSRSLCEVPDDDPCNLENIIVIKPDSFLKLSRRDLDVFASAVDREIKRIESKHKVVLDRQKVVKLVEKKLGEIRTLIETLK